MKQLKLGRLFALIVFFLISGCTLFQHGDDKNYTLCKTLQGQIQFGDRTLPFGDKAVYTREAHSAPADKRRLQAAYDKLDCSRYQWVTF